MALCPGCGSSQDDAREQCESCAAPLDVDGHRLGKLLPSSTAEVDGAGALYVTDEGAHLVRVARPGEAERLNRERTVLGGLQIDGVPRVVSSVKVDGVGDALVMTAPSSTILDAAIEGGLRSDAAGARRFLSGALTILAELEALSPPVHHRNLSPQTLAWDGERRVELIDFSRATDVAADVSGDIVITALDYAPSRAASASARDLYGVGATVVHLLSRRRPSELTQADDKIEFRDEVRVDEPLARFIDRLLDANRPGFPSAAAALAELRAMDVPAPARNATPVLAVVAGLIVLLTGLLSAFFVMSGSDSPVPPPKPHPVRADPPPSAAPEPPPAATDLAKITITSTPPGARVRTGRESLGVTPLVLDVDVGERLALTVELVGYAPARRVLIVKESLTWDVVLKRKPTARKKPAPEFTDDPNAAILRAIERAVRAEQRAFEACDPHGIDRVKFHVVLGKGGALKNLRALGSGATVASRCVEKALRDQVRYPSPPGGRDVSADVWLWLAPRFKVAAF